MKDISQTLEHFLAQYRGQCKSFVTGTCQRTCCVCERMATIKAYIDHIIPDDCHSLELKHFDGVSGGEPVLHPDVVKKARRKLIRYCWGEAFTDSNLNTNAPEALRQSVIDERRDHGDCLVIHGDDLPSDNQSQRTIQQRMHELTSPRPSKAERKKIGRSLLAALVMKEVLKRRLFDGHGADNYEWVQYQMLKARVMAGMNDSIINYQSNDWLVVDNIFVDRRASDAAKAYQSEKIDAVFMERIAQGLPTILVFQFDITPYLGELQDLLGVGIDQIVRNPTTTKICLTNPVTKQPDANIQTSPRQ